MSEEITENYLELKNGEIAVFLEIGDYPLGKVPDAGWWGHDTVYMEEKEINKRKLGEKEWLAHKFNKPKIIITTLKIIAKGTFFELPISSYIDLTEPRNIYLLLTNDGFDIEIQGGETAYCYKAILTFKSTRLENRIVRSCEFPDQVWEKTIYSYIDPPNDR